MIWKPLQKITWKPSRRFMILREHGWTCSEKMHRDSGGSIGHAERVTPDIDSLVSADTNGGNWRSTAIIGGPWENDGSLAFGFFELADAAVERWKAGHRNDAIEAVA
jgi:hypothetical protein